ncbi:MAG: N-acetyl-gamma-glutamyl-phosphate reductase [Paludibacteraceae bacterium]|jgi:N-acetyl-gamma-glutamyl-phosphate reductase|nr:N-acetyl-gamma-glutamyl-phosphate reductase [Paludibacteraceae bacterium]MBQ2590969.1 N-acetyl-gamma-glutamyl-phosphate reductase [Paludibacteraceae bacterium]MCM8872323.1 N-acetyl-gamma-glutamyl-phosphate reductase [Paludibacteraceae bacterium]
MIKAGVIGGAGYTGGELLRILVNHPDVEIEFVNSNSNAGNKLYSVHEGLIGETDMVFTDQLPFEKIDVLFSCLGHGDTKKFLESHTVPANVKIVDFTQDHRIKAEGNDFVYGLPEMNREKIKGAMHIANPGCFATAIQIGLLPLAKAGLLTNEINTTAITGSTGAGQKPSATSHFSWRNNNISVYKAFEHQHLLEIRQSLTQLQGKFDTELNFIPVRGDFARGIFVSTYMTSDLTIEQAYDLYNDFYKDAAFTFVAEGNIDLKQVVNTNKAVVSLQKHGNKLLVLSAIDNLLKGAAGQAVQNMNLLFGLDEKAGLKLKPSAF